MSRSAKFALVVAAAIVLGAIQFVSDGVLQRAAASPSVPRAVPHGLAVRAADAMPLPAFAREIAAGIAIEDGRIADARRAIAVLPRGPARDDLQGRVLEAQGDRRAAVGRYVAAGDFARVSAAVDGMVATGDVAGALVTQRDLVARLRHLSDLEALAHAQWRLAQIESLAGRHESALRDYQAALQLVPLSETYLLGAANEALGLGELDLAARYFGRVVSMDPGSHDGQVGVAKVKARMRR
jgi:tetratricopeptide (TPR) repeat protein